MTGSPTMVLLPCSHSCPPMLVPLFGDDGEGCGGWRTALSSQGTSSPRTWCSSAISPSSFGPSLVILKHFPPQLGPWAYYSKWVGLPRSFGPTIGMSDLNNNWVTKLLAVIVINRDWNNIISHNNIIICVTFITTNHNIVFQ